MSLKDVLSQLLFGCQIPTRVNKTFDIWGESDRFISELI